MWSIPPVVFSAVNSSRLQVSGSVGCLRALLKLRVCCEFSCKASRLLSSGVGRGDIIVSCFGHCRFAYDLFRLLASSDRTICAELSACSGSSPFVSSEITAALCFMDAWSRIRAARARVSSVLCCVQDAAAATSRLIRGFDSCQSSESIEIHPQWPPVGWRDRGVQSSRIATAELHCGQPAAWGDTFRSLQH